MLFFIKYYLVFIYSIILFLLKAVGLEYTVGTESIQTRLHFSLFVILQPFAKIN